MTGHILFTRQEPRPWWRLDERTGLEPDRRVFTDCCSCWMPASECNTRLHVQELPIGLGKDDYQNPYGKPHEWEAKGWDHYSYEDPRWEVVCADGCGCKANPKRKHGAWLRHASHYGC